MQATDYKTWIKNVFDHSAPHYDEVEIGSDYFSKLGQALVNFGCPASGSTVLDVATGKGAVLFALAEKLAGHGRIYGIDLSTEMIKATQAIASKKYNNVQLQAMDAEQLTFADHSFDALFCAFAIFFFPNPSKALKEFNRTLKQNGSLYFSLWDDDTDLDAIFQSNLAKLGVTQNHR
ncbi:MAG: methyltransferase domain-containing protein [Coxiellaceae bacterium]|nr:MAG: methyltransferase domain-containing protein [Coxiellaceae bacterium]